MSFIVSETFSEQLDYNGHDWGHKIVIRPQPPDDVCLTKPTFAVLKKDHLTKAINFNVKVLSHML